MRRSTVATGLVAALAGVLFATSASVFKDSGGPVGDLRGLVSGADQRVGKLEDQKRQLSEEVDALTEALAGGDITGGDEHLAMTSGRASVKGPGVTVILDDAHQVPERPTDNLPLDMYVVHQQDIEAVLNTLWRAGAEAVAVQGHRLTSVSGIRCVGSVMFLGGRTYSPPYTIEAIGDPAVLDEALQSSPLTEQYRADAEAIGLGWSVGQADSLTLPGFAGGSISLRYVGTATGQDE